MTTIVPATSEQPTIPPREDRRPCDTVIYDGNCKICTRQIERLARWDRRGRLKFVSLHDADVAEQFPDLSHEQLMQEMYVIDRRGRRLPGAEAVRYLSRRLPRLWWLAPLLHLPGTLPIWKWCYRQIARRRYHWGKNECTDEGCAVHFTQNSRPRS